MVQQTTPDENQSQTPEWHYMVRSSNHETRHDAVGVKAIINGRRNRIAPTKENRVSVHPYLVCGCDKPQTTLNPRHICQHCGGQISQ